jgi:hypothetical protein
MEPQAETKRAKKQDRRIDRFLKFIPQVYLILDSRSSTELEDLKGNIYL